MNHQKKIEKVKDLMKLGFNRKNICKKLNLKPWAVNKMIDSIYEGFSSVKDYTAFLKQKEYYSPVRVPKISDYNFSKTCEENMILADRSYVSYGIRKNIETINPRHLTNNFGHVENTAEKNELIENIHRGIKQLEKEKGREHRTVIEQIYFYNRTLKDIAKMLGINTNKVRRIQDNSLRNLYKNINSQNGN